MNPLLGGRPNMAMNNGFSGFMNNSPFGKMMQFMNEYKKIKANPSELGQFLYSQGKIDQNQLNEINKLNGDPTKIGEYLINSGSIPRNELNSLQNGASQMQQYISQNTQNNQNNMNTQSNQINSNTMNTQNQPF